MGMIQGATLGLPGPHTCFSRYRDSNYKDKMVMRQSYLNQGNLFSGKMLPLIGGVPRGVSGNTGVSLDWERGP